VESNARNWPQILTILKKEGQPIAKPSFYTQAAE
jgi:hypothetical protein